MKKIVLLTLPLLGCILLDLQGNPEITHICTVSPDVIQISINSQKLILGKQIPYKKQESDKIRNQSQHRFVIRDGKPIGSLVGKDGKILHTMDRITGEKLDYASSDNASSYRIVSPNDENYRDKITPETVYRKSNPTAGARPPSGGFCTKESIFLKLPSPLKENSKYTLSFPGVSLNVNEVSFTYNSRTLRSEAVHVSFVGFRPDDPVKIAFLSCWMGNGGGLQYNKDLSFELIDQSTGKTEYQGKIQLSKSADQNENGGKKNHTKSDVYMMHFGEFDKVGAYTVSVPGVGCSFPFTISEKAWEKAFYTSVRGFFHQRSGIALGPPHTDYIRPRSFHPQDGVHVWVTKPVKVKKAKGSRFESLLKGKTDQKLPNAWGGYMDAGDWDRRALHLIIPRNLLELAELYPAYFQNLHLNLPESENDIPDLVDEALWCIDFYKRMQEDSGGVRFGIESSAHPRKGEASWQESLEVLGLPISIPATYHYAAVAAKAANWFKQNGKQEKANEYFKSALKAYHFAESTALKPARALAAAEFYRYTTEEKWHQIFLENTAFNGKNNNEKNNEDHTEAAWIYYKTDSPTINNTVKTQFREFILSKADALTTNCHSTGFRWVLSKNSEISTGAFTTPRVIDVIRAYEITKDEKYLKTAIYACQISTGANPLNMAFTTGIGPRYPKYVLHEDSRITRQPVPPGITIQGPRDPLAKDKYQKKFSPLTFPDIKKWPSTELYFDICTHPRMCEFTVHRLMSPTAYTWGYLAARGSFQ